MASIAAKFVSARAMKKRTHGPRSTSPPAMLALIFLLAACGTSAEQSNADDAEATGRLGASQIAEAQPSGASGAEATEQTDASDIGTTEALTTMEVRIAELPTSDAYLPLRAAIDLGIFDRNGIEATLVPSASGSAITTAVISGAVDFSVNRPITDVAVAIQEGAELDVVALSNVAGPGFFLASKEGSGITQVSELAGKNICITSFGSLTHRYAAFTNATEELGATLIPISAAALPAALLSGQADACVLFSPASYDLVDTDQVVPLVDYGDIAPMPSVWIARSGYTDEHPELTKRLLKSWYETNAALADPEVCKEQLLRHYEATEFIAEQTCTNLYSDAPTSGEVTMEAVQAAYDIVRPSGVTELPDPSTLATDEFADVTAE